MTARSDAPRNIQELRAKHGHLSEWELQQIDRRWRSLGKMVRHPAALFEVKNYN